MAAEPGAPGIIALPPQPGDATMGVGATPTQVRRVTPPTLGMSPNAKRPGQRYIAPSPPAPSVAMSIEDLTHGFQQMAAQIDIDKKWFESMIAVVHDHAEKIDANSGTIAQSRAGMVQMALNRGSGDAEARSMR